MLLWYRKSVMTWLPAFRFTTGSIMYFRTVFFLYGSAALLDLGLFLILYTVGRTPWTEDQPIARPLSTHRINAHRHPCLNWDSNP
jgi:hypothetical protein